MEQIYYTQCPLGYGLGASNGYQVKRISPGYPTSADFRHLGLKALLPGSRDLAPPTLRYRRDGEVAEIAWLNPRDREFETERGRWGRPGGHFAHGLRLDAEEFDRIDRWPAGLLDSSIWRRSDPEPSRGRSPEPIGATSEAMPIPPRFSAVAPLAAEFDGDWLARSLAAVASVAGDGRTLYIIGDARRIGPCIALITFAFPRRFRGDLTFSTYHDRPEDLSGFRIQGTSPKIRPNRAALASMGRVADLDERRIEPSDEPPEWAITLAGWFVKADPASEASWTATEDRASRLILPEGVSPWSDHWLNALIGLDRGLDRSARPATYESWKSLEHHATWAGSNGLGRDWAEAHPPQWWKDLTPTPEARPTLRATISRSEAWATAPATEWGEVIGPWYALASPSERHAIIELCLKHVPARHRPDFLASALLGFPDSAAEQALDWLRGLPKLNPAILLPLEARQAARAAIASGDSISMADVMDRVMANPAALPASLDAMAGQATRPEEIARIAEALADALEAASVEALSGWELWALRRADALVWVNPILRRQMANLADAESWEALRDRTPQPLWPSLCQCFLETARSPGIAAEPFLWGVESLLLAIPPELRPHASTWAEEYLSRIASGLEIVRKVFTRGQHPGLKTWIAEAGRRGELSPVQVEKLERAKTFARAMASGDVRSVLQINLPEVPPAERGLLLGRMLGYLAGSSPEARDVCLESCLAAWPNGFLPDAEGLAGLARPIALLLAPHLDRPTAWIGQLEPILDLLRLRSLEGHGYEPDGFAAEIVAASTRLGGSGTAAWSLRQALIRDDARWPILGADARIDLGTDDPATGLVRFQEWDYRIDRGSRTERFYEILLNACSPGTRSAVIAEEARDLATLGRIPWRDSSRIEGAEDDQRDAFARMAPMRPIPEASLDHVRAWMKQIPKPGVQESDFVPLDLGGQGGAIFGRLSQSGLQRWKCLAALSTIQRRGLDDRMRTTIVEEWLSSGLPLRVLDPDDAHRFLAQVIALMGETDGIRLDRMARWLAREGVEDYDRLSRWSEDFPGVEAVDPLPRVRFVSDLRAALRTELRELRERHGKATPPRSP